VTSQHEGQIKNSLNIINTLVENHNTVIKYAHNINTPSSTLQSYIFIPQKTEMKVPALYVTHYLHYSDQKYVSKAQGHDF